MTEFDPRPRSRYGDTPSPPIDAVGIRFLGRFNATSVRDALMLDILARCHAIGTFPL
jgi:hypothetical protein